MSLIQSILIDLLYRTLRSYIGGGVADRVLSVVDELQRDSLPGSAKREIAINTLADEAERIGSIALNAAIEITLLKIRGPQ